MFEHSLSIPVIFIISKTNVRWRKFRM